MKLHVRLLEQAEIPTAMALVQSVFMEFDAASFAPSGVEAFLHYIQPERICRDIAIGKLWVSGCFCRQELAGVAALQAPNHISLLFVKREFHRQGVGSALFQQLKSSCERWRYLTVNASSYAVPIYQRWHFTPDAPPQEQDGVRFTPMTYRW